MSPIFSNISTKNSASVFIMLSVYMPVLISIPNCLYAYPYCISTSSSSNGEFFFYKQKM